MILLEPIPNKWAMFQSTTGKPTLNAENKQEISFFVRVPKRQHGFISLASGEMLNDLKGDVTLYRGKLQMEDGQPYPDALIYYPPYPGDDEECADVAGFSVQLYLEESLFDQFVTLSRTSRLPWIDLDFDTEQGQVTYGDDPDGYEKIWNNKEQTRANVAGATLTIPLADQMEEDDNEEYEPTFDPEVSPPTLAQLDRRFQVTHELLTQLRSSLSLLTWTVLGIGAILIGTRFMWGV